MQQSQRWEKCEKEQNKNKVWRLFTDMMDMVSSKVKDIYVVH